MNISDRHRLARLISDSIEVQRTHAILVAVTPRAPEHMRQQAEDIYKKAAQSYNNTFSEFVMGGYEEEDHPLVGARTYILEGEHKTRSEGGTVAHVSTVSDSPSRGEALIRWDRDDLTGKRRRPTWEPFDSLHGEAGDILEEMGDG